MTLAKRLLRKNEVGMTERPVYSTASTVSVAFNRRMGKPPALYARGHVVT